jgi:hypothetical protein
MFVGRVVSISSGSGSGSRVAAVSFKEGPLGGPGDERVINVGFWLGGDTDLVSNKCYIFRGSTILEDETDSGMPRVSFPALKTVWPALISTGFSSSSALLSGYLSRINTYPAS